MNDNTIAQQLNKQPFYVVNDTGYKRMVMKLQEGERRYVKYTSICPHKNSKDCNCLFQLNFLKDGVMM